MADWMKNHIPTYRYMFKMRPNLFLLLHVKYRFISVFVNWLDELEILSLGENYKRYPSALKKQWLGAVSLLDEFNF